jgi:hypothetical protein
MNYLIDALEKLSIDDKSHVRLGVANNPNCPLHVLEKLSIDDDYWVRRGVTMNPNCPFKLRQSLLNYNALFK